MNALIAVSILTAILLGAMVQGASGLGFNLTAAPIINAVMPGPASVGLINLYALVQNGWLASREKGRIHWDVFRVLGPTLALGVGVGFLMLKLVPLRFMPAIVAVSALASLGTLIWWRSGPGAGSGALAGVWSGAVNTYAGVGGPPVASYLVRQGWLHADFLRTLQVVFIGIDLVSLPILGLPRLPLWLYLAAIISLALGNLAGGLLRGRLSQRNAVRLSEWVVGAAAVTSLVYSVFVLIAATRPAGA